MLSLEYPDLYNQSQKSCSSTPKRERRYFSLDRRNNIFNMTAPDRGFSKKTLHEPGLFMLRKVGGLACSDAVPEDLCTLLT